jgi:transketolase
MLTRRELANAIRILAMDAVQKANSGHPGMPMGMADIAEVLWRDYLKFNPVNPNWMNRDRFILSNGHGALLQYALLHLSGFDLTREDLQQFRQLHSKTPGHPEYGETPGVETTTGPLGQGLANGVGMALAEQMLAAQFNRDGFSVVDHYTYVFAGDGDLMEGISHEVCSLAGTWGLGKLIVLYDDNGISIDGDVKDWFTDDTVKRFESYHWHVVPNVDGHDFTKIQAAIEEARLILDRPTLICCKTQIGYGSPNLAGSAATHGAPLGETEIALARKNLNWNHAPFEISDEMYQAWNAREKGSALENEWNHLFAKYETAYPELASELLRRTQGFLPKQWENTCQKMLEEMLQQTKDEATRKSSLKCLNAFAPILPELIGGSADLSESNCSKWDHAEMFTKNKRDGNYVEYGVREFGMSAIMNGMALHRGVIPFGGTFLTFADYARNAVRLSALMKQRVIFVYSHDSIGLGEDGPTHQPVEHISMLRMTPGLHVWRPCDAFETAIAWQLAFENAGPSCLLLTRQNLPQQKHFEAHKEFAKRGAYILFQSAAEENPDGIFIATGSEVTLAVQAAEELSQEGLNIRVVSMPCAEIFSQQEAAYREHVLPRAVKRKVAIEAGSTHYWYQFVGDFGKVIGLNHFGASAPAKDLFCEYGFTVQKAKKVMKNLLGESIPNSECKI